MVESTPSLSRLLCETRHRGKRLLGREEREDRYRAWKVGFSGIEESGADCEEVQGTWYPTIRL